MAFRVQLSVVLVILMINLYRISGDDSNLSEKHRFIQSDLKLLAEKIIPAKTDRILNNVSKACAKAMKNKFEKCLREFHLDSQDAWSKYSNINELTAYDEKWPACCTIFRHHQCIEKAVKLNSFYSMLLCDQTDASIAESILDATDPQEMTHKFCPQNEHIEYELCDVETNRFFGRNVLTTLVLFLGAMALILSILMTSYMFWLAQNRQQSRSVLRFQLLEPTELENFHPKHAMVD